MWQLPNGMDSTPVSIVDILVHDDYNKPLVMCAVSAHVTSGTALIDVWSTPAMSAHCSVYSSMQTSVPANPPLDTPLRSDPMESEIACKHW